VENAIDERGRSFYHSFPRRLPSEAPDLFIARGLELLKGIKNIGLVLAPEVVEWRIPQVDGTNEGDPQQATENLLHRTFGI
jgi:hypothetical protein